MEVLEAAFYSTLRDKWVTLFLVPKPADTNGMAHLVVFALTDSKHGDLPIVEKSDSGEFMPLGPEAQSKEGLRTLVRHPDKEGN